MKKKTITLSFLVTVSTIFVGSVFNNAHTNPEGSPNARTGSPGDGGNTCAISGCHTGTTVGVKSNVITSNIPVEGYTPGTKYTIIATAKSSANRNTFGFQISPQDLTGKLLGAITITNATATQATGGGKYVTHKQGGTTGSNGSKTWSFDWTAPIAGTGNVTFYGAFNHANGNGGSTGDSIFKSTYVVNEKVAASVSNDALAKLGFSIFPNPAIEVVYIANNNSKAMDNVKLFDLNGKLIIDTDNTESIDLSSLESGIYVLKISNKGQVLGSTKILKN